MSRFSKTEAEKRGWTFVHNAEGYTDDLGDGRFRVTPGNLRAEKYVRHEGRVPTLISEQAETTGLLLERIFAWEEQHQPLEGLPEPTPIPDAPKVKLVHDVVQGANPIRPADEPDEDAPREFHVTDANGDPVEEPKKQTKTTSEKPRKKDA